MEPYEYQTLYDFETTYWWYRGLHAILLDVIKSLNSGAFCNSVSNELVILDAGCGTGQNLVNITRQITPHAFGFDLSAYAAPFWKTRGLEQVCRASINQIPLPNNVFDIVLSVDVLECDEVSEKTAYHELWRLVKPGGFILLIVPAYDWLKTPEHHKAVHASRRYNRVRLRNLLQTQPVGVIRITHLFASIFPAVALYRLFIRLINRFGQSKPRGSIKPRSELKTFPAFINQALLLIVELERWLLRYLDMPFGSSILAVVRKEGD